MATSNATWSDREIGDVERRVSTYLADKARNGGIYVKTSRVADDLDITSARAGQAIAKLLEESSTLEIDRWSETGNSGGITWHVESHGPSPYGRECTACVRIVPEAAEDCPHCGRRLSR